ncbi:hypothetical protein Pmar_PMAR022050 [Perkinsus marinus ATCC 50983]|uniref:Uncharacterized protein n=1 Tax=Perkinsus marinus (strain ATCC 50983 / TXsc) TaxID=423536 RepID=C5K9A2_PERM5|nr:hypothetical protein Pmar_PMAR022050 [Perkinsus marinus ATCC 50983]EER18943.1 hypothetical protein Pmar_PMAR022050 [Perkinsus marinus ATCC 50983]|eukprot:XP_002787147.1 hypothetical protein Pmar_PMAR022050 [Perkinsus marinus ATCC 50983]
MVERQDPREFDAMPYFDTEMRQMRVLYSKKITLQTEDFSVTPNEAEPQLLRCTGRQ